MLHPPLQRRDARPSRPSLPARARRILGRCHGPKGSESSVGRSTRPISATSRRCARCRTPLALDRLLLVVANDPWQKSPTRSITPAEDRFAMAQALSEAIPGVEASRMEIDRGGPSYTVPPWKRSWRRPPNRAMPLPRSTSSSGRISLPELGTWERSEDLRQLVTLAVVSRPPLAPSGGGSAAEDPPASIRPAWLAGGVGRWPLGRRLQLGRAGPAGEGCSDRRSGAGRSGALHSPPQSVRCRQMSALPAEITRHHRSPQRRVPQPLPPAPPPRQNEGPSGEQRRRLPVPPGGSGLRSASRSSCASSASPWEFWTCSIEPRVGRARPSSAGCRNSSRSS